MLCWNSWQQAVTTDDCLWCRLTLGLPFRCRWWKRTFGGCANKITLSHPTIPWDGINVLDYTLSLLFIHPLYHGRGWTDWVIPCLYRSSICCTMGENESVFGALMFSWAIWGHSSQMSSQVKILQRWNSNFPQPEEPKEAGSSCCPEHNVIRMLAMPLPHLINTQQHIWCNGKLNPLGCWEPLCLLTINTPKNIFQKEHLFSEWVTLTRHDLKMASSRQVTLYRLTFHVTFQELNQPCIHTGSSLLKVMELSFSQSRIQHSNSFLCCSRWSQRAF